MSVKVEVYTKLSCVYSQRVKDLLRIKGIVFVEHDITDDHSLAAEMYPPKRWQKTPEILIDGSLIGGCDELFELDEQGVLDTLLGLSDGMTPSVP